MTTVNESFVVKVSLVQAWLPCGSKTLVATCSCTYNGINSDGYSGTEGYAGMQTLEYSDGELQDKQTDWSF